MTIRRPVPSRARPGFRRWADAAGHGGRLKATRPPGRDGSNGAFAAAGAPDCNTGEKVGRPTADSPFRLLRKTFNTPADRPSGLPRHTRPGVHPYRRRSRSQSRG